MTDGHPPRDGLDPDFPEDGVEPPTETLEELRASLARADADVAAGRTVDGAVVLAEMRRMIEEYEAERAADGAARA